jgi:hypothetical protein
MSRWRPCKRQWLSCRIAIESVVALPAYQQRVLLAWAPASAQKPLAARSVFFGYDFHLTDGRPEADRDQHQCRWRHAQCPTADGAR